MLITFRSSTQGSVIMFGQDAQTLLDTLSLPAEGEITTAQLPEYLERLKAAMVADKVANPVIWPEELDSEEDMNATVLVHFSQRAAPMLQLMERCLAATETIRWPA